MCEIALRCHLVRDACRVTDREKFVLDDDDLDSEELIRNCRLILEVLAGDAGSFETDIPNGHSDDKPSAVVEAAERLFRATGRSGAMDPDYAQTGVLRNVEVGAWAAFVRFAPYAYDATVWDLEGRCIASLSDEGTAIVVLLTSPQREAVAAIVGQKRLVPLKEWNARRRRVRRTARARWFRGLIRPRSPQ